MTVHLASGYKLRGTRCNNRGTDRQPSTTVLDEVTCAACQNAAGVHGPRGRVRPRYPRFGSAEYCAVCGLSGTHWSGCTGAARRTREATLR